MYFSLFTFKNDHLIKKVMVVNLGLKYIYIYLIDFEGPASRTEKILSLTRKLTFAMFVNTGCLTLILNGNLAWILGGASKMDKLLLKINVRKFI